MSGCTSTRPPPRRAAGAGVVQRLSIGPPIEWERCANVTLSTSGARGVYFLHEGEEPDPATTIVVKPDDAPPAGVALVEELHWTVGGSRTPRTRALDDAEIAKAKATVEAKTKKDEWKRPTTKKGRFEG